MLCIYLFFLFSYFSSTSSAQRLPHTPRRPRTKSSPKSPCDPLSIWKLVDCIEQMTTSTSTISGLTYTFLMLSSPLLSYDHFFSCFDINPRRRREYFTAHQIVYYILRHMADGDNVSLIIFTMNKEHCHFSFCRNF